MPRVKRGVQSKKTHKNILARTKGYRHGRKNLIRRAKEALIKAGQFAYRDRRVKKREFRRLWITQINAACRINGVTYAEFMNGLKKANIELDRKVLSDLARNNAEQFADLVAKIKK